MPNEKASLSDSTTSTSSSRSHRRTILLRDIVIGLADGLTVPFALTAGLSALGNSHLVVMAGLTELLAGSISMGLGAYLAAITEQKRYQVEERRERKELKEGADANSVLDLLSRYGVSDLVARGVVDCLRRDGDMWVKFKMDFELNLAKPDTKMAWIEGCTMGMSYFVGGILPMIPYFAGFENVNHALFVSIGITVLVLVAFGYVKAMISRTTRREAGWCAVQTLCVGALAAGVSYGIVYALKMRL